MKSTNITKIETLLSLASIPKLLKMELLKEFKRLEKYTLLLELELEIKNKEISNINRLKNSKTYNNTFSLNGNLKHVNKISKKGLTNNNSINEKPIKNQIPTHWKKLSFLLIEDNTTDITLLKGVFKIWGLPLDIATTLQEAKIKMKQKYDCILSDVILPDGDGLGNILELRLDKNAVNQNTPVIILTAKGSKSGAKIAQEGKVHCYFNKPYSLKQLKNGLEYIFESQKHGRNISTKVVLNSKASWSWFDILNYNLNSHHDKIDEFLKIFLDQAKTVLSFMENKNKHKKDWRKMINFDLYKLRSTVNIMGLHESYRLICQIVHKFEKQFEKDDWNNLVISFYNQLKKDVQEVEFQIKILTFSI